MQLTDPSRLPLQKIDKNAEKGIKGHEETPSNLAGKVA
jgi:hypothetical protein